jgi:multidrug resistance efflux pump
LVVALLVLGVLIGYRVWLARRPFEWSGTVEARAISVGSRTGGRVKEVLVHEGDRVEARQPLVVLETGDLEAQRLVAQAQLDQAEAALEKLQRGARPEEIEEARARAATAAASLSEAEHGARAEQIAAAKARLVAAQVAADKYKTDSERSRRLFDTGAVSKAEVDNADSNLRGAIAQRDAAQEALNELVNGVRREQVAQASTRAKEARASAKLVEAGARVEDIRAAQALVNAAKGRVGQVQVLLDELVIRAPEKSRVETLDLRPGDIIGPNATAAELLEDDQLYVRIYVPETQLGYIHAGAQVPVFVDSFPGRAFAGVVEHIDKQGEYSPRNLQTADERANQVFATRIGLREDRGDLRAGMAAFIRVPH